MPRKRVPRGPVHRNCEKCGEPIDPAAQPATGKLLRNCPIKCQRTTAGNRTRRRLKGESVGEATQDLPEPLDIPEAQVAAVMGGDPEARAQLYGEAVARNAILALKHAGTPIAHRAALSARAMADVLARVTGTVAPVYGSIALSIITEDDPLPARQDAELGAMDLRH